MTLWNDRQFWLDTSWRAFRTFCQTLAALLAAQFSGLLQAGGVTGGIPHTPWAGLLYASAIAALISLLQSIDRGRAATAASQPVTPAPVSTVSTVTTMDAAISRTAENDDVVVACGDAPR